MTIIVSWSAGRLLLTVVGPLAVALFANAFGFLTSEHCSWETLTVQCAPGQIVIIQSAFYGRMTAKRCISANYAESMGCSADVTSYLDEHCSGRVNCSMLVATIDSLKQPCPKDFKPYLEINYECVKVSFLDDCRHGNSTRLSDAHGYLALYRSPFGSQRGHSGAHCPWVLNADPGKRLTLLWKVVHRPRTSQGHRDPIKDEVEGQGGSCAMALLFRDGTDDVMTSGPCLMQSSVEVITSEVYVSRGSRLEVHVVTDTSAVSMATVASGGQEVATFTYILQYKAFGCVNPLPPEGATMSRQGDDATVTCSESQEKWYLRCQDGDWIGIVDNCTRRTLKSPKLTSTSQSYDELKHGIVGAISVGVFLGIAVGAIMMIIIFIAKKSRRMFSNRQSAPPSSSSGLYELRGSKTCRCPALYVPDATDSPASSAASATATAASVPLYEYTYACRTISSADAYPRSSERMELDKGASVTIGNCAVEPDMGDDVMPEDGYRKCRSAAATPMVFYELDRSNSKSLQGRTLVANAVDFRCTCKQNLSAKNRFDVDLLRENNARQMATKQPRTS